MGSTKSTTSRDIDLKSGKAEWTSFDRKLEGYIEHTRGCELLFSGVDLLVPIPYSDKYERMILPIEPGKGVVCGKSKEVQARVVKEYGNYMFWGLDVEVYTSEANYTFTLRHVFRCGSFKACCIKLC